MGQAARQQLYVASILRRHQREWGALPLDARAAALQAKRPALSGGFAVFGHRAREVFAAAMVRAGSTESELREILSKPRGH